MDRVYLDTCCLLRAFDDLGQIRIANEVAAVASFLDLVQIGSCEWVSSDAVIAELSREKDFLRALQLKALVERANETLVIGPEHVDRIIDLEVMGFKQFDALHVVAAENLRATDLLTVDDQMIRIGTRHQSSLNVSIKNPIQYMSEIVIPNDPEPK